MNGYTLAENKCETEKRIRKGICRIVVVENGGCNVNRTKLIYSILKELEQGNVPTQINYELGTEQWGELLELIRDEGYANGVNVQRAGIGNKVV